MQRQETGAVVESNRVPPRRWRKRSCWRGSGKRNAAIDQLDAEGYLFFSEPPPPPSVGSRGSRGTGLAAAAAGLAAAAAVDPGVAGRARRPRRPIRRSWLRSWQPSTPRPAGLRPRRMALVQAAVWILTMWSSWATRRGRSAMRSCGARPSRWTTGTLRTECAWHCPRTLQLRTRLHQAHRRPHAWHQNVQCAWPCVGLCGAKRAASDFFVFWRENDGKSGPVLKA